MAKKNITPHTALKFIRCDEVAECWNGVEDKLYEKLWSVSAKAPKSTSEAPDSFEGNVADMWSNFTKAEQKRLNELAELGDEGRMMAATEAKELAAKSEEDSEASEEIRKHPEVDATTLAVQQAAVALVNEGESLSAQLLASVQAHLSSRNDNSEPKTRWAALRKAINAAVLDAQSQEVREDKNVQSLPSTIKTLNSFIGKVYLEKPEEFFKAQTMHEVRKLYTSIPKKERSPSAGGNAKSGDQKGAGAGAGVTDKETNSEVKLPKVLADLAALWINLNANGQQQSALDLEQMLRDAAKDFELRGTPQERKQSPTHDPAFADRAAEAKAKIKAKAKTTKAKTAKATKATKAKAASEVPAEAMQ